MYKYYESGFKNQKLSYKEKFFNISFSFVLIIVLLAAIGVLMLYSAASGNWSPWALNHLLRFGFGFALMITIAMIDTRVIMRYADLFYVVTLLLLIWVEIKGHMGMGAQRWINFGVFNLQPSELMKIALVLALAKYFHASSMQSIETVKGLILPLLMVMMPVVLIMTQPDLGTATMLILTTAAMLFAIGVQMWKFMLIFVGILISAPVLWQFLHDYQKDRILTFFDPERDPLGAGYHIIQSKIALGSGGIFGKGFLNGTQSHLNFLPEKHTDFIFTMLSEEFGMIGAVFVVLLNIIILFYCYSFAFKCSNYFGKLVAIGLTTNYFLYVFINIAMVLGLIPVVGVPLPLISYGGTVMLSVMASFGILLSINTHRSIPIGKD